MTTVPKDFQRKSNNTCSLNHPHISNICGNFSQNIMFYKKNQSELHFLLKIKIKIPFIYE